MRSIMYLRPGNMYKEFSVERSEATISGNGRPVSVYSDEKYIALKGCLADATPREIARFAQLGHPITHTIVQQGRPIAKEDDRLHLGNRTFLVKSADEPGSLGICTIYYVEERTDVK